MENNEPGALSRLSKFREVIESRAGENDGKVIQYYGDGCLLIFDSSLEAVTFAKFLQEDFSKYPAVPARVFISEYCV